MVVEPPDAEQREANAYSATWRALFERRAARERTAAEVAFLAPQLPLPEFRRVLDVACGTGRHAAALARLGYSVTGVDREPAALAEARGRAPDVLYVEGDMRELDAVPGRFDAVLCLWQSFGYFDDETNAAVLAGMAAKLRPRGRLVLDVYDRRFFTAHAGSRTLQADGRRVVERTSLHQRRLRAELDYGGGERDVFDWLVYTPDELVELAGRFDLAVLTVCSRFDEATPAGGTDPRMQLVLERRHGLTPLAA